MKAELLNLDKKVVGEVKLDKSIFGLEVRLDIIKRVIDWQRAKSMSGTHKVKTVGEVAGSGKKPFKQKGTGNARQGNARGVQRRGGGVAHGPQVRSHAIDLPKKIRALGLRHALSVKLSEGALHIIDNIKIDSPKTKQIVESLSKFGGGKFFIIDGAIVDNNFKLSSRSIENTIVVPAVGANVYDVVNSDFVLISKDGLTLLEERLKK